jgi:uncharacterized membrane protein
MVFLILGLILFLGTHSFRIFAPKWRDALIIKLGNSKWKALYSTFSIVGFVLIIFGYGQAKLGSIEIWSPPLWTWYITVALNLVAFVLLTAAYFPKNLIKVKLKDPMILGVKTWALAHFISNGSLAGITLFGSFLIWAILDFKSCRGRSSLTSLQTRASSSMTFLTLLTGVIVWILFVLYAHQVLIGINPLPQ